MNFEIASTGSAHNYTRSYYMNGRDYVISGSCDEHVVHICCAQTGKRLRDVDLEVHHFLSFRYFFSPLAKCLILSTIAPELCLLWFNSRVTFIIPCQDWESGNPMFVQSLRGDPSRVNFFSFPPFTDLIGYSIIS